MSELAQTVFAYVLDIRCDHWGDQARYLTFFEHLKKRYPVYRAYSNQIKALRYQLNPPKAQVRND